MPEIKEVLVPDIGDFEAVEVIEVPINDGDKIQKEDTLITLESDKATIDIPSPSSGTIKSVSTRVGDKVSQGDLILTLEQEGAVETAETSQTEASIEDTNARDNAPVNNEEPQAINTKIEEGDHHCEVVVLGGGPGGYTAAFRAADLGKQTVLIERYKTLGGVCLNVGCIPSKALLHIARVISEVDELKQQGIDLGTSNVNIKSVREFAVNIVNKLTTGLKAMAKQRKVEVVHGTGKFIQFNKLFIINPYAILFRPCSSHSTNLTSPKILIQTGRLFLYCMDYSAQNGIGNQ